MIKQTKKVWRNIFMRNWNELPGFMKGDIWISYNGRIVWRDECPPQAEGGRLPESFDPEQDLNIICGCDLEPLAGFKLVRKDDTSETE